MNGFGNSAGDWLIVARTIHFAATAITTGTLIFRIVVAQPVLRLAGPTADMFEVRTRRIAGIGLLVSVVSGVAWILLQAPAMSGLSFAEVMTSDVIGTVVTETQFGLVSEIRLALAVALAACFLSDRPAAMPWIALASALGLIASIAWTGHAGSTAGGLGIVHLISDALHLIAAAAWIGGLVSLTFLVTVALRHQADGWVSLVADTSQRFSRLGIVSVVTLLITGIVNAGILVGSLHALLVTGYGRLLMLKMALFAIMLAFAAVNKFWLTPAIASFSSSEREREVVRRLVRNCAIEIALGLAIFAIVGALGTMHPASHLDSLSVDGST
jgi:putative copper resistance protein D